MKILFGIPVRMHREIADAEVAAFEKAGAEVATSFYGNSGEVKGKMKSLLLIFKNAFKLQKKLKEQNSDIVYLNTAFDSKTLVRDSISVFILKLFKKNIKIVLKTHGTIQSTVSSKSALKNYLFNHVDLILVLSKAELENFLIAGLDISRLSVTANPVDIVGYLPDADFRKKLKIEENEIILLFVGRFMIEKGIMDLINACKLLQEKQVPFQLICLGNGPLFDDCVQLAAKLQLDKSVRFMGHIPEKDTKYYYSNCDVLILPTYHEEGFPMAIFQAAACGKAIITTKIRAAADYFKEYENCLWVEPKNPENICEKVTILERDKILAKKLGSNNFMLAKTFTSYNIVKKLYDRFQLLSEN